MSICTLQREVYCLWLGDAMVLSERVNAVGPAADALGVWRGDICRMASQRRPCGECGTSVPTEGQPERAGRCRGQQSQQPGNVCARGRHCWVLCCTCTPLPASLPGLQSWWRAWKHPMTRPWRSWGSGWTSRYRCFASLQRAWAFKIAKWGDWECLENWETAL